MGPHSDGTHLLDEILHRIDESIAAARACDHHPPRHRPSGRAFFNSRMRFQSCAGMPAYENSSHAADLMALVNVRPAALTSPASINPVVGIAARPKTRCPIYLLDWERSGLIQTVWSPKTGIVHAQLTCIGARSGDHRPEGLLLAYGPAIPRSTVLPSIEVEFSRRASRDVWV